MANVGVLVCVLISLLACRTAGAANILSPMPSFLPARFISVPAPLCFTRRILAFFSAVAAVLSAAGEAAQGRRQDVGAYFPSDLQRLVPNKLFAPMSLLQRLRYIGIHVPVRPSSRVVTVSAPAAIALPCYDCSRVFI